MPNYLGSYSTLRTHQSRPLMGSNQVENSAGGFVWEVDKWERLQRFLILGAEGGTYYIGEQKLIEQNADALNECTQEDGQRVVKLIHDISVEGRAPKNDQALFALAFVMAHGDVPARRTAAVILPAVARTGYHLFVFAGYLTQFRGWGRVAKRAVADWYLIKDADKLAYQVVKYRQREGFDHNRLLNVSHPAFTLEGHVAIGRFIKGLDLDEYSIPFMIEGFQLAQKADTPKQTAEYVNSYGLTWEMVKTEHLNDPLVWEALLETMPVMATIRNLPKLTQLGLVGPQNWETTEMVVERIQGVKGAKVHPMQVLFALKTYSDGHGFRSSKTWKPVSQIVEALDSAFYKAFDNVEPTGKTIVLGLDVSGSMGSLIQNSSISAREAAVAMAMVTQKVEPRVVVLAFCHELVQLDLNKATSLADAVRQTSNMPFGATDCALPMTEATAQGFGVDCFQIYTDNETWFGDIHPKQALDQHRKKFNPNAKSVVVAMVSNGFSIADPNDPGMLDVVGFDTTVPAVMADFVR